MPVSCAPRIRGYSRAMPGNWFAPGYAEADWAMASTNSITQPRVMAVVFDYLGVILRVWRNVEKSPISPGILQEFVAEWRMGIGEALWNLENMETWRTWTIDRPFGQPFDRGLTAG